MATHTQFDFPALALRRVPRALPMRDLVAWLRAAVARWRERRMLEEFDERMLRDIGISRSQALAEARKPWWRR